MCMPSFWCGFCALQSGSRWTRDRIIVHLGQAAEAAETAAKESLARAEATAKRMETDNQRLLDLQTSQHATQKQRLDELAEKLNQEHQLRTQQESEVRRLSRERSERIVYLSQQRDRLINEASQAKSRMDELTESQKRATAACNETSSRICECP